MRRLEVSVSGRWYLLLTILLGVVALVSGNNVLYLTESLLLSGLILSGVASERAITAVRVQVHRGPARAGEPTRDMIVVRNPRRFPVFCLEIREWRGRRHELLAFLPRVAGRSETSVRSIQQLPARGEHAWDGIAVATSAPFGFARKLRLIRAPGKRLVWPSLGPGATPGESSRGRPVPRGAEFSEGEIREHLPDDDSRLIVWPRSAPDGELYVRQRRPEGDAFEVTLDTREPAGPAFERKVIAAARPFHQSPPHSPGAVLTLVRGRRKDRVRGKRAALDELARVQAEGSRD